MWNLKKKRLPQGKEKCVGFVFFSWHVAEKCYVAHWKHWIMWKMNFWTSANWKSFILIGFDAMCRIPFRCLGKILFSICIISSLTHSRAPSLPAPTCPICEKTFDHMVHLSLICLQIFTNSWCASEVCMKSEIKGYLIRSKPEGKNNMHTASTTNLHHYNDSDDVAVCRAVLNIRIFCVSKVVHHNWQREYLTWVGRSCLNWRSIANESWNIDSSQMKSYCRAVLQKDRGGRMSKLLSIHINKTSNRCYAFIR